MRKSSTHTAQLEHIDMTRISGHDRVQEIGSVLDSNADDQRAILLSS